MKYEEFDAQYRIPWTKIEGVQVGNAQDTKAGTGVTVLYFPTTAQVGVYISGGGPASRETPLLAPETATVPVNAIVLSGGSAYGLAAADGVMHTLEENGIGFPTGFALVPIVCQSCIYDLSYGRSDIRPDAQMGRDALMKALSGSYPLSGNYGAGTGATVGKMYGMERAMKSGIGYYALTIDELTVGAVVVVNAWGDVYDTENGQFLAGMKADGSQRESVRDALWMTKNVGDQFTSHTNTTIGAIVTNADFTQAELTKLAAMGTNGYIRSINPVGTMADGDTLYAASTGKLVKADINRVGSLASFAVARAIKDAVLAAQVE